MGNDNVISIFIDSITMIGSCASNAFPGSAFHLQHGAGHGCGKIVAHRLASPAPARCAVRGTRSSAYVRPAIHA
jgi:hypothetical protein